ncbi:uncharacterized protein LOC144578128 [Callithrix jacchus]
MANGGAERGLGGGPCGRPARWGMLSLWARAPHPGSWSAPVGCWHPIMSRLGPRPAVRRAGGAPTFKDLTLMPRLEYSDMIIAHCSLDLSVSAGSSPPISASQEATVQDYCL